MANETFLTNKGRKTIVNELFFDEFGHLPGETKVSTPAKAVDTSCSVCGQVECDPNEICF